MKSYLGRRGLIGLPAIFLCLSSLEAAPDPGRPCETTLVAGSFAVVAAGEALESPPIEVPEAAVTLILRHRWRLGAGGGRCIDADAVEIRIGAGPYAEIVAAGGSFASGGPAWCGTSPGWPAYATTELELPPAAAGRTVQIRWRQEGREGSHELGSVAIRGSCAGDDANLAACDDGNPCTIDTGLPPNCMSFPNDNAPCDDGNPCTPNDRCFSAHCFGFGTINCDDNNPCTTDGCVSNPGCIHANATGSCDDGNACTTGDACSDGACTGTPAPTPPEATDVAAAADKATYSWSTIPGATRYDVLHGSLGAFPIGPGGGDEGCFGDLAVATLTDPATPAADSGVWYIVRGENACGSGTYGARSDGTPRISTTCP